MKNTLATLAFICALLAIVLTFLPLRNFALIPALSGIILAFIAYLIAKKNQSGKKAINIAFLLCALAIAIVLFFRIAVKEKVANDKEFKQKIDSITKSTEESDLNNALMDSIK